MYFTRTKIDSIINIQHTKINMTPQEYPNRFIIAISSLIKKKVIKVKKTDIKV